MGKLHLRKTAGSFGCRGSSQAPALLSVSRGALRSRLLGWKEEHRQATRREPPAFVAVVVLPAR